MKKIIFFLLLVLLNEVSFAQQPYSRYIDYTSEWFEVGVGFVNNDGACTPNQNFGSDKWNFYRRHIIGDTTISGNSYFILQTDRRDSTHCVLGGATFTFNQNPEYHFVREDSTGKIFHYANNTDNILWDFNLQVGDSISGCKIVSVDSVWLGNEPRKRFHCDCVANNFLIEGVGCPEGLYNSFSFCGIGFETNSYLVCYHKQGEIIYIDTTQTCELIPLINTIDDNKEVGSFEVYPNPNNGVFKVTGITNSSNPIQLKLFSSFGKLIYSSSPFSIVNKTYTDISVNNLATGIYIVQLIVDNKPYYKKLIIE